MSFTLVEEKKKKKPRQMTLAKLPRKKGPCSHGMLNKINVNIVIFACWWNIKLDINAEIKNDNKN